MFNEKNIKSYQNTKKNLKAIAFIVLLGILLFTLDYYVYFNRGYGHDKRYDGLLIIHPIYLITMGILLTTNGVAAIGLLFWKNWARLTLVITVGLTVFLKTFLIFFMTDFTSILKQGNSFFFLKSSLTIIFWFYIFYLLSNDKTKGLIKTKGDVSKAIELTQKPSS